MESIKLTDTTSIYKLKYDFSYSKELLLKRAYQIIDLRKTHPTDKNHFFYIPFRCNEIDFINEIVLNACSIIDNSIYTEWAIQNWVYKMDYKSQNEIYHNHIDLIEGDGRIKTDWTFCLYVQIPKYMEGNSGKISFKTNDGIEHMILPEEGDLLIFPADLLHTPKLIKNSKMDRIVIAGNISLNPLKKIQNKQLV